MPMRLAPRVPATIAWLVLLGCGPAASLDDPASTSSGPSTGAGPFGDGTAAPDPTTLDGAALDLGGGRLDVAPEIPLPPGFCPPDCQLALPEAWVYDGPPAPLGADDRVEIIGLPGDAAFVIEQRHGTLVLALLSELGQELWTLPLALPCTRCRLVDVTRLGSGDLLLGGHGEDEAGNPVAVAARVRPSERDLAWATSTPLAAGPEIVPRAGSLVAVEGLVVQPVLQRSNEGPYEQRQLLYYDLELGGLVGEETMSSGPGTGQAPPPRAVLDANGAVVVTYPERSGELLYGTVLWLDGPSARVLASAQRVEPSLRIGAANDRQVVTLGQTAAREESLLYVDSGSLREPDGWQLVYVLPTVTSRAPSLFVDGIGHAHVLARSATGQPGRERSAQAEVLRWSDEGELVWRIALPLAFDLADEPVSIAVLPDSGDLLLAGFVAGARHAERRTPSCDCD